MGCLFCTAGLDHPIEGRRTCGTAVGRHLFRDEENDRAANQRGDDEREPDERPSSERTTSAIPTLGATSVTKMWIASPTIVRIAIASTGRLRTTLRISPMTGKLGA